VFPVAAVKKKVYIDPELGEIGKACRVLERGLSGTISGVLVDRELKVLESVTLLDQSVENGKPSIFPINGNDRVPVSPDMVDEPVA
jgi:hypothetical protein